MVAIVGALLPLSAAAETVFVRANQVGYRPRDVKVGISFSTAPLPARFAVAEAAGGRVVFRGMARRAGGGPWATFGHHAELDFSTLATPGRYVLCIGESFSLPFSIGDDVYSELPDALLEFMRQRRCGYNPWLGASCHALDGRTAYGSLPAGTTLDAAGGWHDAADLLKYLLTSSNATAQMLVAYLVGGSFAARPGGPVFSDRVDARGDEGGNGIPDLLDEARWGLEWMLRLHPAPDVVAHQVADDRDHVGFRLPPDDTVDYGWGPGGARVVYLADGHPQGLRGYTSESAGLANLAGRYGAAMALAWQVWNADPRERAFAQRCLQAGREVYELGRAREGVQQGNSFGEPYRYEETTWTDDMEWGAAELYRATGDRRYLEDATRYAKLAGDESWMGREQARHYQFYPFLNLGHYRLHGLVDRSLAAQLAGHYRAGIERCITVGKSNPYRIGVPFIWCSNNLTTALATQCLLLERMTGERHLRRFGALQRDWLLGRNPWGTTMFTEVGGVFPTDVHLQTTKLTGRRVRGGLVDGPVAGRIFSSQLGVTIREPDALAAFQDPRAVYHDDVGDYSTNEPTMDGTASAILLWVLCATQPR